MRSAHKSIEPIMKVKASGVQRSRVVKRRSATSSAESSDTYETSIGGGRSMTVASWNLIHACGNLAPGTYLGV